MGLTPIFIIVGTLIVALAVALVIIPPVVSSFTNDAKCPTGSAICSTAAMMPGAVSIMSALIIVVSIGALVFVVFYIRSH